MDIDKDKFFSWLSDCKGIDIEADYTEETKDTKQDSFDVEFLHHYWAWREQTERYNGHIPEYKQWCEDEVKREEQEARARRFARMDAIYPVGKGKYYLNFSNAEERLKDGLKWVLSRRGEKGDVVWRNCYNKVVEWLEDNHGKGLLIAGGCGLGKTMLGYLVLARIISQEEWAWETIYGNTHRPKFACVHATELNENRKLVLSKGIVFIDDVGTESMANDYGEKHLVFSEVVDNLERRNGLLVVTTNLTPPQITEKYGVRTLSRLKSLCKSITFNGKDLRG